MARFWRIPPSSTSTDILPTPSTYRCYFAAYEALIQHHVRSKGVKREDVSPLWAVGYGAAAGKCLEQSRCILETVSFYLIRCVLGFGL